MQEYSAGSEFESWLNQIGWESSVQFSSIIQQFMTGHDYAVNDLDPVHNHDKTRYIIPAWALAQAIRAPCQ